MRDLSYPGSRWWKFDFHNHTPASSDYNPNEKDISPRDWLLAYMRAEIDCVVVTDHNCSDWIEKLKVALEELSSEQPLDKDYRKLTIFPGLEITTTECTHILAIFDPKTEKAWIDGILCGQFKISNQAVPNAERIIGKGLEDVVKIIQDFGGLAISAHTEKSKGILEHSIVNGKIKFNHSSRTLNPTISMLNAIECHNINNAIYTTPNSFSDILEAKIMVSGSDAHNTQSIGNRYTWVRMSVPTIEGLRLALLDKEAIVLSDKSKDYPQPDPQLWIRSLKIENLHLCRGKGLDFDFNPAYTSIIGGRGAGKSTLLECLRLALGRTNELANHADLMEGFERFRKEYDNKEKIGLILPNSKISVEVFKGMYERYLFVWSKNSSHFSSSVSVWEKNSWVKQDIPENSLAQLFPVKMFSQKQVFALANNTQNILGYIDDCIHVEKENWKKKLDLLKKAYIEDRVKLRELKSSLLEKPKLELQQRELQKKIDFLKKSHYSDIIHQKENLDNHLVWLNNFNKGIKDNTHKILSSVSALNNSLESDFLESLNAIDSDFKKDIYKGKKYIISEVQYIQDKLTSLYEYINEFENKQKHSSWYEAMVSDINAYEEDIKKYRQNEVGTIDLDDLLKKYQHVSTQIMNLNESELELISLNMKAERSYESLCLHYLERAKMRKNFINDALRENDILSIEVRPLGNLKGGVQDFRDILRLDKNSYANLL